MKHCLRHLDCFLVLTSATVWLKFLSFFFFFPLLVLNCDRLARPNTKTTSFYGLFGFHEQNFHCAVFQETILVAGAEIKQMHPAQVEQGRI